MVDTPLQGRSNETAEQSEAPKDQSLFDKVFGDNNPLKKLEQKSTGFLTEIEAKFSKLGDTFTGFFKDLMNQFESSIVSKAATSGGIFVILKEVFGLVSKDEKSKDTTPRLSVSSLIDLPESKLTSLYSFLKPKTTPELFRECYSTTLEACQRLGADPSTTMPLALAIFQKESGFNPQARNGSSGASGIGQHMPGLWAARAKSLTEQGIFKAPPDIMDLKANIYATVQLIKESYSLIKGSNDPAAAVYLIYNCGGAHAWIAKYNLLDKPDELRALFKMTPNQRVAKYPGSATFKLYALNRCTPQPNIFQKFSQLHSGVIKMVGDEGFEPPTLSV